MPNPIRILLAPLLLAGAILQADPNLLWVPDRTRLNEGKYPNDANPLLIFEIGDGKAWITSPDGAITWQVGRDQGVLEYHSYETWMEINQDGDLILYETMQNDYTDDLFTYERWRQAHASPGKRFMAMVFMPNGKLIFPEK
ncbi:hypothetical protein [Mesoterricola silvestris]|uniref:Bulb-type lectin domain-containing protein n=1 Tax=Mesoterricola silvestris TaxID=2927979 RepID=A0AA48GMD7_9BACT|nr:hypothetical protein [Mesoterricola silvestris]BDU72160.1 hypothetical protein METEAL_13340 [Mesoterricola silvestris]